MYLIPWTVDSSLPLWVQTPHCHPITTPWHNLILFSFSYYMLCSLLKFGNLVICLVEKSSHAFFATVYTHTREPEHPERRFTSTWMVPLAPENVSRTGYTKHKHPHSPAINVVHSKLRPHSCRSKMKGLVPRHPSARTTFARRKSISPTYIWNPEPKDDVISQKRDLQVLIGCCCLSQLATGCQLAYSQNDELGMKN